MAIDTQLSDLLNNNTSSNIPVSTDISMDQEEEDTIDVSLLDLDNNEDIAPSFSVDEEEKEVTEDFVPELVKESTVAIDNTISGGVGDNILIGGAKDDTIPSIPLTPSGVIPPQTTDDEELDYEGIELEDILKFSPHLDLSGLTTLPEKIPGMLEELGERALDPKGTGADQPNEYGIRFYTPLDMASTLVYGLGKMIYELTSLGYHAAKYSPEVLEFLSKGIPKDPFQELTRQNIKELKDPEKYDEDTVTLKSKASDFIRELLERTEDVDNKPLLDNENGKSTTSEAVDAFLEGKLLETWGAKRKEELQYHWDIPADRQNAFTRFTMLAGEYGGLITVLRKAGAAGGVSVLDYFGVTSPSKLQIDAKLDDVYNRILKKSEELATSDRDTSLYLRHLHRKYKKLSHLRDDMYAPVMMSKRALKLQDQTVYMFEKSNVLSLSKEAYRPIGEMAASAAFAQTAVEQSLDYMGMGEYKPYAPIAGFLGALGGAGVLTSLAMAVPKAVYNSAEQTYNVMRAIYAKKAGLDQEYRRYTLKASGYSDKEISTFYTESPSDIEGRTVRILTKEVFESKLIDPKIRETMDGMAQALNNIPDENIRNEIFASIRAQYSEADGLMRGFNQQLQKDIDDGLIQVDDLGDLSKELRLNFDQMMHLTAMTSLKNMLTEKLKLGLVRQADKMKILQTLDLTTRGLQQQTRLFEKGLEGILKRVSQTGKGDPLKTETNWRAIVDHMTNRKNIIDIQNKELSTELTRILEKSNPLDMSKGPEFDAFMDGVFGKSLLDDSNRHAMAIRASLGFNETDVLDEGQKLRVRAEAQRRFGDDTERLFDVVQNSWRERNRTLYLAAGASKHILPIEGFMARYSDLIDKAIPNTGLERVIGSAKSFLTKARKDGLELDVSNLRAKGYDDEQIFIHLHRTVYTPATRAIEEDKVITVKPLDKFFDANNELKENALEELIKRTVNLPASGKIAEIIPANASYQTMTEILKTVEKMYWKTTDVNLRNSYKRQYHLFSDEVERMAAILKEGRDKPANLLNDVADTWYRNTSGETFKKWAAAKVDHNLHNRGVTQNKTKIANYEFWNDIIDFQDPAAASKQFVTMFTLRRDMKKFIKDSDGKEIVNPNFGAPVKTKAGVYEIDPEAKRLFLTALRRRIESDHMTDKKGLQNLSDVAVDEFFIKTGILNSNNAADVATLNKLAAYRGLEGSNPDIVATFENSKKVLEDNIGAIKETLKAKLSQSAFEKVERIGDNTDRLFEYLLTDNSLAFAVARREASFLKGLVDKGDLPPEVYDNLTKHRASLENEFAPQIEKAMQIRQAETGEAISKAEYLDRLTGLPIGNTDARQPLLVILDDFEKNLSSEKFNEFTSAVKSLMVSSLVKRNISFSDAKQINVQQKNNVRSSDNLTDTEKSFSKVDEGLDITKRFVDRNIVRRTSEGYKKGVEPYQPSLWVQSTQDLPHAKITLAKRVDIAGFVQDFNNIPDEVLARIYTGKEGEAHLAHIKKLTEIGSLLYGKTPTGVPQDMGSMSISRLSLLNRIYNWNRNFVSGRFLIWDMAARQGMVNQAKYLERVLTDPNAAETMVNFVKEGPKNALKYKKFFKSLAMRSALQAEEQTLGPSEHTEAGLNRLYWKPEKVLNGYMQQFFEDIAFGYNRRHAIAISGQTKTIYKDIDVQDLDATPPINLNDMNF